MQTFAVFFLLLIGGAAAAEMAGTGSASEMGGATIVRREEIERVGTERVLIDSRGHTTSAQQKHIAGTNKNDRTEDPPKDKHGRPIYKGNDGREYTPVSSRTCDSQNIARDQKELFPILDQDVCRSAAEAIYHTNTEVEEIEETDRPEGCFAEKGKMIRFNTAKGGKATQEHRMICTSSPPKISWDDVNELDPHYIGVKSGSCKSKKMFPVLDQDGCGTAAEALELPDTEAEEVDEKDRPEGCFYKESASDGKRLWFNTKKGGKAKDGRVLLCTATPPPAAEKAPPVPSAGFFGYLIGMPVLLALFGCCGFLLSLQPEMNNKGDKKKKKNRS